MAIFITSFKHSDITLREKRSAVHYNQLDWFLAKTHYAIYVAINTEDHEYYPNRFKDNSRITFIELPDIDFWSNTVKSQYLFPFSRELKDKWHIFADDDALLYDESFEKHCDGDWFLSKLEDYNFPGVDVFGPVCGIWSPYLHKTDLNYYADNFVFKPTPIIKGSLTIVRNSPKIKNWVSGTDNFNGEDIIFCVSNILSKNGVYQLNNLCLKENGPSTWAVNRNDGMISGHENASRVLRAAGYGVGLNDKNKLIIKNKSPKIVFPKSDTSESLFEFGV